MKSNRRRFVQTLGTGSAGLALGATLAAAPKELAAGNGKVKDNDGQVLLVGENIAVTQTQCGKVRGYHAPRHQLLSRHAVWSRYLRSQPLHAAAETEALDRRLPGALVGQFGAAEHG